MSGVFQSIMWRAFAGKTFQSWVEPY